MQDKSLQELLQEEIAARKTVEAALAQQKAEQQALLANLGCAIYRRIHDTTWTVLALSPEWEQITGYPSIEFLAPNHRPLLEIIHPDDIETVRAEIATALAQRQIYEFTYRIFHANGEIRWLKERGQGHWNAEEERYYLAGSIFDITAQKEYEVAIVKLNTEMAEAARLKDEFFANITHEVRTPLSVILTIAESLQEGIYGPTTERQVEALSRIRRSSHHLLGLINDLLNIAQVESGQLSLHLARTSVAEICRHTIQMMQELATKKRIKLTQTYNYLVDTLWADEQRLAQILVNLLSNAIKFTPEGGHVGLEVSGKPERGVVQFSVWDTGIGITHADTYKLFRPFVQVDSKLSRQHNGSGLGLSLVYRLTQLHGGSITVASNSEKGSRFTVTLPWSSHSPQATSATGRQPLEKQCSRSLEERESDRKILVIEDQKAPLSDITNYLHTHHYAVLTATTSAKAVALAKQTLPDLILIDPHIPDCDSLESIRQIRAIPQLHQVPIVALTSLSLPDDEEIWRKATITLCVVRPVTPEQFLSQIHQKLQNANVD